MNKMKKTNKTNKKYLIIESLIIISILIFFIWTIVSLVQKDYEIVFDRLFGLILGIVALFEYRRLKMSIPVLFISVIALLMHHMKLYGNVYFGIPFDRIQHFIGVFAIALIMYHYIEVTYNKKYFNKIAVGLVVFFIAFGIGASIEIVEFLGYSYLGEGEGVLFYGTGDFGEYNNIGWDLIANSLGALLAILIMSFISHRRREVIPKHDVEILRLLSLKKE